MRKIKSAVEDVCVYVVCGVSFLVFLGEVLNWMMFV
ncbi:unknown [Clostridium sp. CAG:590]|nr:unknown [Clostridium sp. CAG:590]